MNELKLEFEYVLLSEWVADGMSHVIFKMRMKHENKWSFNYHAIPLDDLQTKE